MPSKTKKEKDDSKIVDQLGIFDRDAKKVYSFLDNGYQDRMIIDAKDQKFRNILNRELEISKGISHGSIVDFVSSLNLNKQRKDDIRKQGDKNPRDGSELFTRNINDIFGYFQEMYKNRFLEIDDLRFISKFIPALGEAVKTTLDSLVSSDNIAETVNRKIKLSEGVSSEDQTAITNEIERIEKETKLLKKLKTQVYKKTLITGTHYVYAVPYNKIFAEYERIKHQKNNVLDNQKRNRFCKSDSNYHAYGPVNTNGVSVNESYMLGDIDITPAMENVREILQKSELVDKPGYVRLNKKEIDERLQICQEAFPDIRYYDSDIFSEAMESAYTIMETPGALEAFKQKHVKPRTIQSKYGPMTFDPMSGGVPDGTKGSDYTGKETDFEIPGVYLKFIEPKNLIPLRVFDQVIGYYLIHPKDKKKDVSTTPVGLSSIGNTLFSAINIGENKKHDAVNRIVNAITDGILQQFDKKFVTDNAEYKKLIADVIIANGLTDKDYNIQFIPADDIIPFTIQEREDGFGESILADSLFPAKLLLSMIVTRMLNYINKTGNKTIAHIHRGQTNVFDTNQLNRVIRDLQDSDITFNDLLSPNLVFNKLNRDGNMAIPTSRNGDKLIEFEVQEGQQIDMTPEYEKILENMAIMGTSVPTVIMEYIGSAEFAKQIVSANIKFAGHVASLQSDVEESTTLLYKKLVEHSNLTYEQKAICAESLEIQLPRPRVLINSNNNEYISQLDQAAEALADMMIGRDSVNNTNVMPDGIRIKEKLKLNIAKKDSPYIEWEEYESLYERAVLEVREESIMKSDKHNANASGGSDLGGF